MLRRMLWTALSMCLVCLVAMSLVSAQGRGNPNPLRTITRTIYTPKTEFFAVYRPYVIGQEGRFSAHLTHMTDRFEAYPVGTNVAMRLTVGGSTVENTAMTERSGVFYFLFTPTAAGTGTVVITLTTPEGREQFEAPVTVEPDLQTAVAHQAAAQSNDGIIRYTKEDGWDGRFATAPVVNMAIVSGKAAMLAVPRGAVVDLNGQPHVYVQRDPEAFYLRPVKTGEGNDRFVAVTEGLREGDRIVTIGVEKLPRR